MKVLLISDNHGNKNEIEYILNNEVYDISIHCGDSELSEDYISKKFTYYVAGNNDYWFKPQELKIDLDGIKTLILHGHTRGIYVFTQTKPIEKILMNESYDLILHGHSHIYRDDVIQGTRVICPGSTNLPRSEVGKGYVILEIVNGKIISSKFKNC